VAQLWISRDTRIGLVITVAEKSANGTGGLGDENMVNPQERDPQTEQKETPILNSKGKKKKLRVGVYLSSIEEAQEIAEASVKAGFRRGGLPILIKKPHGFPGEMLLNADGIGPYLWDCHKKRSAMEKLQEGLKGLKV